MDVSEDWIRAQASEKVYARGEEYFEYRHVRRLERRGDVLLARVEGTEYRPYRVTIRLEGGAVAEAACSCPYDWGGYCKHLVAVLLEVVRRPRRIRVRPAPDALVGDLDDEQLRALLAHLVERHPQLLKAIERWRHAQDLG